MVCISTGQLIEFVQWSKNGVNILSNSSEFNFTQGIVRFTDATYAHFLVGSRENFLGTFTCEVRDSTGRFSRRSLKLNGKKIILSFVFTVVNIIHILGEAMQDH